MSSRSDAFSKPLPDGWRPAKGDRVFIRGRLVARGEIVEELLPDLFKIRIEYGRKHWVKAVLIGDLRPIKKRATK